MNRRELKKIAPVTLLLWFLPFAGCTAEDEPAKPTVCVVKTADPHADCSDSAQVINELEKFTEAFSKGDFDYCASCLDENCTFIDQSTSKAVTGKKVLLEEIKRRWDAHSPSSKSPLVAFTINSPYAHVKGDTCVVSFVALKEYKGEYPAKYESHSTEIYVKKDKRWYLTHYRSNWKRIS